MRGRRRRGRRLRGLRLQLRGGALRGGGALLRLTTLLLRRRQPRALVGDALRDRLGLAPRQLRLRRLTLAPRRRLADLWTNTLEVDEYVKFLDDLLVKMKVAGLGVGIGFRPKKPKVRTPTPRLSAPSTRMCNNS